MRSAPGRSCQVGTSRSCTAKAWRPSWPPSKTAAPTVLVPLVSVRSLVPIVAGSGHTSPLGPFRPAHGETSIRLVTMGHLLGRHQSLGTRPALDGRSAGRSPTLAGRGRAVKRLSEGTPRRPPAPSPRVSRTGINRNAPQLTPQTPGSPGRFGALRGHPGHGTGALGGPWGERAPPTWTRDWLSTPPTSLDQYTGISLSTVLAQAVMPPPRCLAVENPDCLSRARASAERTPVLQ